MGADAVALGTRFVASRDNPDWHPAYAQRILDAREGEDVVFSAIYGPSRSLPSDGIAELAELTASGADNDVLTRFKDLRLIAGQRDGDMQGGILPCGQIAGAINDLINVADFVPAMVAEARTILVQLGRFAAAHPNDGNTTARG
jgi:NAD(P)H-dependent flavin oxidoreductase YrpB (nitropropane dioxygenase family)